MTLWWETVVSAYVFIHPAVTFISFPTTLVRNTAVGLLTSSGSSATAPLYVFIYLNDLIRAAPMKSRAFATVRMIAINLNSEVL